MIVVKAVVQSVVQPLAQINDAVPPVIPEPSPGNILLVDADGAYLLDDDGAYLEEPI